MRHACAQRDVRVRESSRARKGGQQPLAKLGEISRRTAPPPAPLAGGLDYMEALNTHLVRYLRGVTATAEQAMRNVADEWDRITERIGVERQLDRGGVQPVPARDGRKELRRVHLQQRAGGGSERPRRGGVPGGWLAGLSLRSAR